MKYIRTKCGKIIKHPHPDAEVFTFRYEIDKVADTIEELIQDGDLVEFKVKIFTRPLVAQIRLHSVTYGNGIELSVPGIAFGTDSVLALWIKLPNGDFHKVAEKKSEEGEIELL